MLRGVRTNCATITVQVIETTVHGLLAATTVLRSTAPPVIVRALMGGVVATARSDA